MDENISRVYVNPNFNRIPGRIISESYSNNHFYVNPNFTRTGTNVQQCTNVNRKIYVNPNFIIKTNTLDNKNFSENVLETNNGIQTLDCSNSTINRFSNPVVAEIEQIEPVAKIQVHPSSKSRYHLVRKNSINATNKTQPHNKETCTIKINKYKSIPLYNFKNSLQIPKIQTKQPLQYVDKNNFKLIRSNFKPTSNPFLKLTPKSLKIKKQIDLKLQLKLRALNGNRKKNNIPCRLFTKYGKCLRNIYGNCKYLHDKKHVSLCRKFIKGICHDKQCLLSHELSSKKMPTCYFYLNGMCTKEDCPYLHVKLSEKSKICHDFIRGYCDKGDKCLHRHVQQQIDKSKCKTRYTFNKHTSDVCKKLNVTKSLTNNQLKRLSESRNNKIKVGTHHNEQVVDDGDCRYFKELENKEAMCEVLKPTRCKLGTLPSFIRL